MSSLHLRTRPKSAKSAESREFTSRPISTAICQIPIVLTTFSNNRQSNISLNKFYYPFSRCLADHGRYSCDTRRCGAIVSNGRTMKPDGCMCYRCCHKTVICSNAQQVCFFDDQLLQKRNFVVWVSADSSAPVAMSVTASTSSPPLGRLWIVYGMLTMFSNADYCRPYQGRCSPVGEEN